MALVVAAGGLIWRGAGSAGERPAAAYVGAAACAGCHGKESADWSGSQHAVAMREANDSSVRGDFNGASFTYAGATSTFFRRGGKYLVRTDGPDGTLQEYEIRYTFGVSPLQQYLIALPGGRLQPLSIAWDTRPEAEGGARWFHLYPGQGITHTDELHWTGRQQNWNYMCSDCHSTNVKKGYDAAADSFRTTWSEIDVSCEACHGPGSRHVEWAGRPRWYRAIPGRSSGFAADLDERRGVRWSIDPATGNARRSVPRTSDVEVQACARCHSRRAEIAEGYEPGEPLLDHYLPSLIMPGLYHADGQQRDEVYTYGSFLQSRMFHAGVTCSDCHEPHTQRLRAEGNALCAGCHAATKYDNAAHTFHGKGGTGAKCVSCHMPATTYMQVDARRDHSIRIPRPDQTVALGVPNACNRCHTDRSPQWAAGEVRRRLGHDPRGFQSFAEAFAADERGDADAASQLAEVAEDSVQPAIVRASALARLAELPGFAAIEAARGRLDDSDPAVRRAALLVLDALSPADRADLAAPLLADPVRAVRIEAARILAPAAAAVSTGEYASAWRKAEAEFIASQRYNGDRPESHVALGNFIMQMGRAGEAEAEYRTALRLEPRYLPAYVNLADLYRATAREADAERTLRAGLAVAPGDPTLHQALGLSLARSGRVAEAVAELGRAAALAPGDPRMTYAYAVALNSAGRGPEAIALLERARQSHPADRDILLALTTFTRDAGDLVAARRYAGLLFNAHPNDPDARALLQSLGGGSGQ